MQSLSVSLIAGELTDPLIAGDVTIAGPVPAAVAVAPTVDQNSRRMLEGAFDVAEMSFATFLKAREQGRDLIGLPIFTGRGFLQPGLLVAAAAGIERPEDLAGKRVGVPQYWMTSSVWHRGLLTQQHGIADDAIRWLTATGERFDGVTFPGGVAVERLPDGISVEAALERGLVDAIMIPPRGVPKTLGANVRRLYPDVRETQRAYVAATGVFPIVHFVVMRAGLAAQAPWLPDALMTAFTAAKDRAREHNVLAPPLAGLAPAEQQQLFGADPWAFGIAANAATLATFLGFAREQGWIAGGLDTADCFVAT